MPKSVKSVNLDDEVILAIHKRVGYGKNYNNFSDAVNEILRKTLFKEEKSV